MIKNTQKSKRKRPRLNESTDNDLKDYPTDEDVENLVEALVTERGNEDGKNNLFQRN